MLGIFEDTLADLNSLDNTTLNENISDSTNQLAKEITKNTSDADYGLNSLPRTGPISRVAFIFALGEEANGFIERYELKLVNDNPDAMLIEIYEGKINDLQIIVSINAIDNKHNVNQVGSETSALNTYIITKNYSPSLIVNAGTAGGFISKNAKIGEVFISDDKICFHDHRIAIPGFHELGIGSYPTHSGRKLANTIGLKAGKISSGNSLDLSDIDLKIMRDLDVSVKEMEAAAIAKVADLENIPFIAIKSITDLVDSEEDTSKQFLSNFKIAVNCLNEKLFRLIEYVISDPRLESL